MFADMRKQADGNVSRPAAYYLPKISGYIKAHPKTAYNEAIADILSRFRDNPQQDRGASRVSPK